jgi:hypothetical protein
MTALTNRNASGVEPSGMFNSFGKQTVTTTIANDATRSSPVDFRGFRSGIFRPDTNFDGTVVTYEVSDTLGGTYSQIEGLTGTALTDTGEEATKWYPLPPELAGAPFFKFVFATNQTTQETTITLCLIA